MPAKKVAMITGAAGGIGRAAARELVRAGYDLALLDIDEAALQLVGTEIEALGGRSLLLPGDLNDMEYVERAVQSALAHFHRIDVLVNNAAWRELSTMREISLKSWERTLRVCLTAPAFLARWCVDDMQQRGQGVVINVTSIMARQAAGFSPAYVAAKGALESLTYELAALYGPRGIRVVALAPGAIETQLSDDVSQHDASAEASVRQYSEAMIPLGRWGTAEEIARTIVWLAGENASYVHGTTITVDGGWTHHHLPTSQAAQLKPGQF